MKRRFFIAAAVLLGTAVVVFGGPAAKAAARAPVVRRTVPAKQAPPPAAKAAPRASAAVGYRPVGVIAFANPELIARAIAGIPGPNSKDPVLTQKIPNAIRGQYAVRVFGAMRPGGHGVAVCYVDPAVAARVAAKGRVSDAEFERVKRWCVVYPTAITKTAFLQRHPTAVPEPNGALRVPPGPHSQRTLWAWFAPDGQWAVLAPSASMAVHAYTASAALRARKLGPDLCYAQMGAAGARAIFGTDLFADGELSARETPLGLEIRVSANKIAMKRPPMPPGARTLAGVPANALLYGMTTTPSDVHMAENLFSMVGPEFGDFLRKSLRFVKTPGATTYYMDVPNAPASVLSPRDRLFRLLPEARTMPAAANAMFCAPTTLLSLCLPKIAAKLMPMDSVKLHVALRLLRRSRGDGLACMSWHDGRCDHLLVRVSRDELWGTANLWSLLLF